ncbi:MAG: FAD-dependent oxidoreductase [Actinobacteria bacterium]|nr:MAG: FAD-dependent oxidoreductase [Actinomycetota bacterium]
MKDIFVPRRMWRPRGELKRRYDVVVVGGGSHGLATAYYLAQRHGVKDVCILEKSYIGSGASGRNTTIIRANYRTPEGAEFYGQSVRLYEKLSQKLGFNLIRDDAGACGGEQAARRQLERHRPRRDRGALPAARRLGAPDLADHGSPLSPARRDHPARRSRLGIRTRRGRARRRYPSLHRGDRLRGGERTRHGRRDEPRTRRVRPGRERHCRLVDAHRRHGRAPAPDHDPHPAGVRDGAAEAVPRRDHRLVTAARVRLADGSWRVPHRSRDRALRGVQGEDRPLRPRAARRKGRRQARQRDRDHAYEGGRGEDDDRGLADAGPRNDRPEPRPLPARGVARAGLRNQGRRGGRRLCAGRTDGGPEPPLHRRHPRDRRGEQPPRGDARGARPARKRARDRSADDQLAPLRRHQRPRAPRHRDRARGEGERVRAADGLRHHGGLRGDGDRRGCARRLRSPCPSRRDHRRLDVRGRAGHSRAAEGRRCNGGPAQGRDQAEHRPDARGAACARPLRPVREHRPRQQLPRRGPGRLEARRRGRHRERLRLGHGDGEVLRHRLPRRRAAAERRRRRRDREGPEAPRR